MQGRGEEAKVREEPIWIGMRDVTIILIVYLPRPIRHRVGFCQWVRRIGSKSKRETAVAISPSLRGWYNVALYRGRSRLVSLNIPLARERTADRVGERLQPTTVATN